LAPQGRQPPVQFALLPAQQRRPARPNPKQQVGRAGEGIYDNLKVVDSKNYKRLSKTKKRQLTERIFEILQHPPQK